LKQPLADVTSWSGPDERERQLLGVSTRTTGFRQGIRNAYEPASDLSRNSAGPACLRQADVSL